MSGCTGVWSEVMSPGGRGGGAHWQREGGRRAWTPDTDQLNNTLVNLHVIGHFCS